MKKILLLMLLSSPVLAGPSVTGGTPITQAELTQIDAAQVQIFAITQKLALYVNGMTNFYANGIGFSVPGSTQTVVIPASEQNMILDAANYLNLKQQLIQAVNQLP